MLPPRPTSTGVCMARHSRIFPASQKIEERSTGIPAFVALLRLLKDRRRELELRELALIDVRAGDDYLDKLDGVRREDARLMLEMTVLL